MPNELYCPTRELLHQTAQQGIMLLWKEKKTQTGRQTALHASSSCAFPQQSTVRLQTPCLLSRIGNCKENYLLPICAGKYVEFAGDKCWGCVISVLGVSDTCVWFVSCNTSPRHMTGNVLCLATLQGVRCSSDLCSPQQR